MRRRLDTVIHESKVLISPNYLNYICVSLLFGLLTQRRVILSRLEAYGMEN